MNNNNYYYMISGYSFNELVNTTALVFLVICPFSVDSWGNFGGYSHLIPRVILYDRIGPSAVQH